MNEYICNRQYLTLVSTMEMLASHSDVSHTDRDTQDDALICCR